MLENVTNWLENGRKGNWYRWYYPENKGSMWSNAMASSITIVPTFNAKNKLDTSGDRSYLGVVYLKEDADFIKNFFTSKIIFRATSKNLDLLKLEIDIAMLESGYFIKKLGV